jgi:hypothetical protein
MADALGELIQLAPSLVKLATSLMSTADTAKRNAQLIEFQTALIGLQSLVASVQQDNATLIRQKRETEEELERLKDWDAQKKRYKLAAPFAWCMVYALQKAMCDGEPAHYLCAACFQKGQASILQSMEGRPRKEGGRLTGSFLCPACRAEAFTSWINAVAPQYFEDIRPEG